MKTKIAFAVGLAIGYIFGTRAGRERYEQIKKGASAVWESSLVKRGRDQVGGYASGIQESLQDTVITAGRNFLQSLLQFSQSSSGQKSDEATTPNPKAKAPATTAKKKSAKKPASKANQSSSKSAAPKQSV